MALRTFTIGLGVDITLTALLAARSSASRTWAGRILGATSSVTVMPCRCDGSLLFTIFAFAATLFGMTTRLPCPVSRLVARQFVSATCPSTSSMETQSPSLNGSVALGPALKTRRSAYFGSRGPELTLPHQTLQAGRGWEGRAHRQSMRPRRPRKSVLAKDHGIAFLCATT